MMTSTSQLDSIINGAEENEQPQPTQNATNTTSDNNGIFTIDLTNIQN